MEFRVSAPLFLPPFSRSTQALFTPTPFMTPHLLRLWIKQLVENNVCGYWGEFVMNKSFFYLWCASDFLLAAFPPQVGAKDAKWLDINSFLLGIWMWMRSRCVSQMKAEKGNWSKRSYSSRFGSETLNLKAFPSCWAQVYLCGYSCRHNPVKAIECTLRKANRDKEQHLQRTLPLLGSHYAGTSQWSINNKHINNSCSTFASQLTPKKQIVFQSRWKKVVIGDAFVTKQPFMSLHQWGGTGSYLFAELKTI